MNRHITATGRERCAQGAPMITIAHVHIHTQHAQRHKGLKALLGVRAIVTKRHTATQECIKNKDET